MYTILRNSFFAALVCAAVSITPVAHAEIGPSTMQLAVLAEKTPSCDSLETKKERVACRKDARKAKKARANFLRKKEKECKKRLKKEGGGNGDTQSVCKIVF